MNVITAFLLVAALCMWVAALVFGIMATYPIGLVSLLGIAGAGLLLVAVLRRGRAGNQGPEKRDL